jgi:hypothetical protein
MSSLCCYLTLLTIVKHIEINLYSKCCVTLKIAILVHPVLQVVAFTDPEGGHIVVITSLFTDLREPTLFLIVELLLIHMVAT